MGIQEVGRRIGLCDLDDQAPGPARLDVGDDAAAAQGFFHGPGLFVVLWPRLQARPAETFLAHDLFLLLVSD